MRSIQGGIRILLLVAGLFFCSAGMLWALPILNDSGDGVEDYPSGYEQGGFLEGERFAYYQNSGTFMFIGNYNNESNLSQVQADVISWLNINMPSYDTSTFTLVDSSADVTFTGVDYYGDTEDLNASASGTYQVDTSVYPGGIEFYAVKASKYFAMYAQFGGEAYGSWSTYDLWLDKGVGTSLEISHYAGYNGNTAPVPEPATMFLLGSGLAGLAALKRKKV